MIDSEDERLAKIIEESKKAINDAEELIKDAEVKLEERRVKKRDEIKSSVEEQFKRQREIVTKIQPLYKEYSDLNKSIIEKVKVMQILGDKTDTRSIKEIDEDQRIIKKTHEKLIGNAEEWLEVFDYEKEKLRSFIYRNYDNTMKITQKVVWVDQNDKLKFLSDLLLATDRSSLTLIFTETQAGAKSLVSYLSALGLRSICIHEDINQPERTLNCFCDEIFPVLVATSVTARGLDIPNVRHVINYDVPTDLKEYVRQIRRSGRGGTVGLATSFFNESNLKISHDLIEFLIKTKQEVPEWLTKEAANFQKSRRPQGSRGSDHFGSGVSQQRPSAFKG